MLMSVNRAAHNKTAESSLVARVFGSVMAVAFSLLAPGTLAKTLPLVKKPVIEIATAAEAEKNIVAHFLEARWSSVPKPNSLQTKVPPLAFLKHSFVVQ